MTSRRKNHIRTAMLICFAAAMIMLPSSGHAADPAFIQVNPTYIPLAPLPCIPGNGLTCTTAGTSVNFEAYVQYLFNFLIAAAAVAAVFMIVFGGFEYMTADAVQNKNAGVAKIKNAVYGLLLVLCSYLILRTIDPRFVEIPVNLVAPLNLSAPKSFLSQWGNALQNQLTLSDQASFQQAQIQQLLQKNSDDAALITQYDQQTQALQDQILDAANKEGIDTDDASALCQNTYIVGVGPDIEDLCGQMSVVMDKENQVKGDIVLNTATGVMGANIQKCLSAGAVSQAAMDSCTSQALGAIQAQATNARTALMALGQNDKAQLVLDQSRYSAAMAGINEQLARLSSSPYFDALVQTVKQMNTDADTALGAYVGLTRPSGTLTGAGLSTVTGYAAASYINNNLTNNITAANKQAAQVVVAQIKDLVSQDIGQIKDPAVKQLLKDQSQAIITQLGGQ